MKKEEHKLLSQVISHAEEAVLCVARRLDGESDLKELRRLVEKLNNSLCLLDRMIREEDAGGG